MQSKYVPQVLTNQPAAFCSHANVDSEDDKYDRYRYHPLSRYGLDRTDSYREMKYDRVITLLRVIGSNFVRLFFFVFFKLIQPSDLLIQ